MMKLLSRLPSIQALTSLHHACLRRQSNWTRRCESLRTRLQMSTPPTLMSRTSTEWPCLTRALLQAQAACPSGVRSHRRLWKSKRCSRSSTRQSRNPRPSQANRRRSPARPSATGPSSAPSAAPSSSLISTSFVASADAREI